MSYFDWFLSIASQFSASLLMIVALDFCFKIQAQFAWSVALKKRLPINYGPITASKLLLIFFASACGTLVLIKGGPGLDGAMLLFAGSLVLLAAHGCVVYWKEMRDL